MSFISVTFSPIGTLYYVIYMYLVRVGRFRCVKFTRAAGTINSRGVLHMNQSGLIPIISNIRDCHSNTWSTGQDKIRGASSTKPQRERENKTNSREQ